MNRKRLHILVGIMMRWIIFIFCRPLKPADISTLEIKWVLALIQYLIPFGVSEHFYTQTGLFYRVPDSGCAGRSAVRLAVQTLVGRADVCGDGRHYHSPLR